MKRKLVITQNLNEEQMHKITKLATNWEVITGKERDAWENHLHDAEVIVGWKKEMEKTLTANSKLRWLQSWSAGVNSLPLKKMENLRITLTSANGVHAYPISETIFALMLGLTRKIHTYVKNQQSKTWHNAGLKLEIHGKTVGIIGVGAIGKETAKIAKAFGMRVIGIRHSGKQEKFVNEMYVTEQLNYILPKCDYVVVTLPLTTKTYHLFGQEQFTKMKSSAFFINIGRGQTVDEEALISALISGEISGAGLDVFEEEPLSVKSPLWDLENVIITPHTAGSTEHYTKRVFEDIFIPNFNTYINGKTPSINVVDYKKGY